MDYEIVYGALQQDDDLKYVLARTPSRKAYTFGKEKEDHQTCIHAALNRDGGLQTDHVSCFHVLTYRHFSHLVFIERMYQDVIQQGERTSQNEMVSIGSGFALGTHCLWHILAINFGGNDPPNEYAGRLLHLCYDELFREHLLRA